ncbi:MAG: alpha/beta hydrolase fold domain-containing protein [Opitutae bacterium]|nr:alpha/beta hydrolase fold domain-containing protein [Opitutae bacterium]
MRGRRFQAGLVVLLPPVLMFGSRLHAAPGPVHLVLVEDSTVTDRSGWGMGFRRFVTDGTTVTNTAQGGRSSKSFLAELHAASRAFCEKPGPAETAKLNPPRPDGSPDTTHLAGRGSVVFARLVAEELRRVVPALAPILRTEPAGGAVKLTDVEYGRAEGGSLRLDVSVPEGDGPFPVAILVHGGGWSSGDKAGSDRPGNAADITPWFAPLTAAKFTWFSLNYRLAPAHRWPAGFEDVQTAIRWVKAHAAEFKGDPRRIALIGHSAGGHLVCLAATTAGDDTRVQAVVGFAPVTDFEFELPLRGGLSPSLQMLHNQPKEPTPASLTILRATAPINHVKPGLPPFLLLHGDADRSVPYQTSLNFQAKLRANGVPCELITVPGAPHGLSTWGQIAPDYPDRMVAWLRRVLSAPRLGLKRGQGASALVLATSREAVKGETQEEGALLLPVTGR